MIHHTHITEGGPSLVAEIIRPEHDSPLRQILWIHGWQGDRQGNRERAKSLTSLGYTSFVFDLRGHGESRGDQASVTPMEHGTDVIRVYDALVNSESPCYVVGTSYGGYLAMNLLEQARCVSGLVLRSPSLFADRDLLRPTVEIRNDPDRSRFLLSTHDKRESAALRAASEFQGPVCLIEAGNDEVIPGTVIKSYLEAFSGAVERHVIPEADHVLSNPEWKQAYVDILVHWFTCRTQD